MDVRRGPPHADGQAAARGWGLAPARIPLGGYIYEACAGQDPIYRLGMLGYFETKNIGRKRERAEEFRKMGDCTSEVDMEFDWADETLHAELGRRWLKDLLEVRARDPRSGRRCSRTARSSSRNASRARPPTTSSASERRRRARARRGAAGRLRMSTVIEARGLVLDALGSRPATRAQGRSARAWRGAAAHARSGPVQPT